MRSRSSSNLIPGLILIVIGGGFLLGNLGFWDFSRQISIWWPLIVIAFGLTALIDSRGKFAAWVVLIVGVVLQLSRLGIVAGNVWSVFWPIIVVAIGLSMLGHRHHHGGSWSADKTTESTVDVSAIFSGANKRVSSKEFRGGSLTASFGGIKLDLQDSELKGEAELSVSALFGGVEIIVPREWTVEVLGTPFFGGWENHTEHPKNPAGRLIIKGTATFGGIEIKN